MIPLSDSCLLRPPPYVWESHRSPRPVCSCPPASSYTWLALITLVHTFGSNLKQMVKQNWTESCGNCCQKQVVKQFYYVQCHEHKSLRSEVAFREGNKSLSQRTARADVPVRLLQSEPNCLQIVTNHNSRWPRMRHRRLNTNFHWNITDL